MRLLRECTDLIAPCLCSIFNRCISGAFRFIEPMRALACENIRFSSLFATGDVSRGETSPAAKREEKRMFSQAMRAHLITIYGKRKGRP